MDRLPRTSNCGKGKTKIASDAPAIVYIEFRRALPHQPMLHMCRSCLVNVTEKRLEMDCKNPRAPVS